MLRFDMGRVGTKRQGPAGRIVSRVLGSVFFGLFFGLGCVFVVVIAREAWQGFESRSWPERPATIVRADVSVVGGENAYEPQVEFRYDWNGTTRTSRLLALRETASESYADAAARIARYPVGATIPCHVAPDGRAILEHGSPFFALLVLFPMIFVAIGAVGLVVTWKPKRRDASGVPVEEPISRQARPRAGSWAMTIFGAIFALVGAALLWPTAIGPALGVWQARGWPAERCTVERSEVLAHESDDGTTYSIDILYRFERDGRTHRSNRYSFFGGSSSGRDGKREIVRAHPVGREVICFVDPEDPAEAVLERGVTAAAFVGLLPLAFLAVGSFLIVRTRRQVVRRRHLAEGLLRTGRGDVPKPEDPVHEWLPDFDLAPGPVSLEPEWSRLGKLAAIVFACLFWNGIVAVFVREAMRSFERGRPDWGMTLFLVPFVLVGILLVFAILHATLGLANARPVLRANHSTLALGDRLELDWHLTGRVSNLRRLALTLEGQEVATYQRGTDTHTVSETFASLPVFDSTQSHAMSRGRTAITLPNDTMHSFEGGHNAIRWSLHLVGEIDRWPDLDERFPLVFLPLPERRFVKSEDSA